MNYSEKDDWVHIGKAIENALANIHENNLTLPRKEETYYKTLLSLKEYYKRAEPEIIKIASKSLFKWFFSYPIDWLTILTPIELQAWNIIRSMGKIVLYPQYPVGPYFADFANPYLKIVVEIDGKVYHFDKEKDKIRDKEMILNGWTVFRITGAEIYRDIELDEDDQDVFNDWLNNTGEGVFWAIREVFFNSEEPNEEIIKTLNNHCSGKLF